MRTAMLGPYIPPGAIGPSGKSRSANIIANFNQISINHFGRRHFKKWFDRPSEQPVAALPFQILRPGIEETGSRNRVVVRKDDEASFHGRQAGVEGPALSRNRLSKEIERKILLVGADDVGRSVRTCVVDNQQLPTHGGYGEATISV